MRDGRQGGKRTGILTARGVQTARKPGLYGDGANLFLKIGDNGAKSWIFCHQVKGKVRKYGLGPLHTVSLSDARDRAEAVRKLVLDGIDPKQHRQAELEAAAVLQARTITFDDARDRFIASQEAGWRNSKHAKQWRATLATFASPTIGKLPVSAVDTGLVLQVLQPIWATKTETASWVRGRIEAILDWATVLKYRSGPNPALWRGNLDKLLPKKSRVAKVEHHAALPYAELPAFLVRLRKRQGVPLALEFTILTCVRTSEALGAVWGEFDDNRLWIIPAERMKADKEHRVPLSDRAVAILEEMKALKASEFVFPGHKPRRPLSNMAMLTVLRRMKLDHVTTAHGFRSTFTDWAREQTGFPREVIEAVLAHAIGDKTEAAYARGDLLLKRRRLMEAWAGYCSAQTGKVIPIRA